MAATTTIRIERDVHARLVELSATNGRQLIEIVREATSALERVYLAEAVHREIEALRSDPSAWAAYIGEAELAAGDGIS